MPYKLRKTHLARSTLVATLILSRSTTVLAQTNLEKIIKQSDRYIVEPTEITQVYKLRDVSQSDWAYEALRNLAERYGCIFGLPNQTYGGKQVLSRDEFATGLNSCLRHIESLISSSDTLDSQDLEMINRLSQDFNQELAMLRSRVNNLDSRLTFIDDHQFSTITILTGEAVFGLGSVLTGSQDNGELDIERIPFLGNQINLELATSFTGEDELSIELEAANLPELVDITDTFQGELSFSGSNDNNLELDLLAYAFPLKDNLEIIIGTTGLAADDIAETINFFESDNGGKGAISNFGSLNPIYETSGDAGFGIIYELGDIEISAGYLASPANQPTDEGGIFNAPYGVIAQAIISPSDRLNLAFTYIHSRDQSDTDTGSKLANLKSFTEDEFDQSVPTVSDSYGAEFSYELSDFLVIGGWGGLSKITTLSSLEGQIDRGTQDVWNWAITLAFPDLGKEGNLGGMVVGAEPWVTDSSIDSLGEDNEMSLHLETFYQYQLTDYIAITPGIVWITAPSNNDQNDDLIIGAIRTTFAF